MTMEATRTEGRPVDWTEQRERLSRLVQARITKLQGQYCQANPTPKSKAALAQLRRSAGGIADARGYSPDTFAVDMHTHVPPEFYPLTAGGWERRFTDAPTEAETAVHSAMTLYAVHQQSRRQRMHGANPPGAALARLAWKPEVSQDSVRRRFSSLITADNYAELSHHLRTLIRMLRDHTIPMDYGRLTKDLFTWQYRKARGGIRLSWSRDFENNLAPRKSDNEPNPEGEDNS